MMKRMIIHAQIAFFHRLIRCGIKGKKQTKNGERYRSLHIGVKKLALKKPRPAVARMKGEDSDHSGIFHISSYAKISKCISRASPIIQNGKKIQFAA